LCSQLVQLKRSELPVQKYIGMPVRRKEDRRLVTGHGRFLDDVKLPGTLFASFVRSPYPHALIKKVELGEGSSNGIITALSGEEVKNISEPFPHLIKPPRVKLSKTYCLAVDKVRFVGEPVVAIAVDGRYSAEDALEAVNVEYEELPAVLDAETGIESTTLVHDHIEKNLYAHNTIVHGDVEAGFRKSFLTIEKRFKIQRHTGTPMEPHGVIADFDPIQGTLKVWASTQIPHDLRTVLSIALRMPEARISVIAYDVGGGYGNYKYHPEDIAVCLLSIKARRPVKWVSTRSELLLSGYHSREQTHYAKIGVDRDGKIVALQDKIIASMGAYLTRETIGPQTITSSFLPGPYKVPNLFVDLYCVALNKAPSGAYRGFGQPQACFVMERLIDLVSHELKLDPAEVRFRNFISENEFPYKTATGLEYDSGDYASALRKALDLAEYESLANKGQKIMTNSKARGIGIGFYVEVTNFSFPHSRDRLTLTIDESGAVKILTGLMPHGQGLETMLAQIGADTLGLDIDKIDVVFGNTSETPYGQGTFGSRSATSGSETILAASEIILDKARKIACEILDASPEELEYRHGTFSLKSDSTQSVGIEEIAKFVLKKPSHETIALNATVTYDNLKSSFAYGVHVAIVDIDLETGALSIPGYIIVHDCGTVINPMIVDGQIHGGLAQGLGGALLDETGQLMTSTFMDYLIPTACDIPDLTLEHSQIPSPVNRLGVKGAGEGGIIPVAAALANGIENALRRNGGKIGLNDLPLTPEKIWKLSAGK
jgi:aerobic carbon-monoxide dehydrogenase large subunit